MVSARYSLLEGFNSRTLGRVRLQADEIIYLRTLFQFTHPGKGATGDVYPHALPLTLVSIHAPWEGCDGEAHDGASPIRSFQFTHPGKGATGGEILYKKHPIGVSIHAPWEGCDGRQGKAGARSGSFNSRTLGRVRRSAPYQILLSVRFQFTHPGKGATNLWPWRRHSARFQFTHPGKGATRSPLASLLRLSVSIHAPWEGCDGDVYTIVGSGLRFNSRTLGRVRRRTQPHIDIEVRVSIHAPWEGCDLILSCIALSALVSIHAPWEGCDCSTSSASRRRVCFNSRTLGRVRLAVVKALRRNGSFQFTHPGKGATGQPAPSGSRRSGFNSRTLGRVRHDAEGDRRRRPAVSIHAPWEGCDRRGWRGRTTATCFNSRTLGRVRHDIVFDDRAELLVSIHAPWEGCDSVGAVARLSSAMFQFTHPGKGATV